MARWINVDNTEQKVSISYSDDSYHITSVYSSGRDEQEFKTKVYYDKIQCITGRREDGRYHYIGVFASHHTVRIDIYSVKEDIKVYCYQIKDGKGELLKRLVSGLVIVEKQNDLHYKLLAQWQSN